MVNDDSLPWNGPTCPQCGLELDVEPVVTGNAISIGYSCSVHGIVSIADPFADV